MSRDRKGTDSERKKEIGREIEERVKTENIKAEGEGVN